MKLSKILTIAALAISGIIALIFVLDLSIGIPFGRFNWLTDLFAILASSLVIWQAIETYREL